MKRVLIALKDDIHAQQTAEALHAKGHWPVSRGRCYQSSLGAVDGNQIDVAIVDDLLDDGKTGANVVRALTEQFNIEVIFVSADEKAQDALTNVNHRMVHKPVSADLLACAVSAAPAATHAR